MESLKFTIFVILVALTIAAAISDSEEIKGQDGGFLQLRRGKLPENYTCNKFPRVCRRKGSAGPDCCKRKCVNVKKDRVNCGMCGYKCKYTEMCCGGKCVNASFERRHCGGCNKRCKKGQLCVYGMCDYA